MLHTKLLWPRWHDWIQEKEDKYSNEQVGQLSQAVRAAVCTSYGKNISVSSSVIILKNLPVNHTLAR